MPTLVVSIQSVVVDSRLEHHRDHARHPREQRGARCVRSDRLCRCDRVARTGPSLPSRTAQRRTLRPSRARGASRGSRWSARRRVRRDHRRRGPAGVGPIRRRGHAHGGPRVRVSRCAPRAGAAKAFHCTAGVERRAAVRCAPLLDRRCSSRGRSPRHRDHPVVRLGLRRCRRNDHRGLCHGLTGDP